MPPVFSSGNGRGAHPCTPADLDRWVREHGSGVDGAPPSWVFRYEGVDAYCQCQSDVDRMRIVAPVCRVGQLNDQSAEFFEAMLKANYHSALDPRYALDHDLVMSAYLHPLKPLTEAQFLSGLRQVVEMVKTFGTTFSSTGIVFGSPE